MIEAEFHVVYKNIKNELIDITPHENDNFEILFLEDNSLKYCGYQINNIRKNISKSKLIDKCIDNLNKIFEITNSGKRKEKHGLLNIEGNDAQMLYDLDQNTYKLLFEFYNKLKLKPNDFCICGNNLKFIDYCKKSIQ